MTAIMEVDLPGTGCPLIVGQHLNFCGYKNSGNGLFVIRALSFLLPTLDCKGDRSMISHVKKLIHFDGLEIDGIPGRHGDSAKLIGDYTTEDRALQGMTRVADQPGFRDWPDSFRLFDIEVDRDFFREGFRTGNGEDIAIADNSSGYAGNDEGLEE